MELEFGGIQLSGLFETDWARIARTNSSDGSVKKVLNRSDVGIVDIVLAGSVEVSLAKVFHTLKRLKSGMDLAIGDEDMSTRPAISLLESKIIVPIRGSHLVRVRHLSQFDGSCEVMVGHQTRFRSKQKDHIVSMVANQIQNPFGGSLDVIQGVDDGWTEIAEVACLDWNFEIIPYTNAYLSITGRVSAKGDTFRTMVFDPEAIDGLE